MSIHRIANRYAKALLELAEEQKALDKVRDDMILFEGICQANRDFVLMLNNPVITHDKKLKILKSIFSKKVHKITNSFFDIATRKNRETVLLETAKEFLRLYNIKKGIQEVVVTTTFKLDKELRDVFHKKAEEITGKKVVLEEKIDKELIGGYILKVEDRQIDDSVRSKLRELSYKFNEDSYVGKSNSN